MILNDALIGHSKRAMAFDFTRETVLHHGVFSAWTKSYPWGSFLSHGERPQKFADLLRGTAPDALRRDGLNPCVLSEARPEAAPAAVSSPGPPVPRLPARRVAVGAALRHHRGA